MTSTPSSYLPFTDPDLSPSDRLDDLIGRMTLEEKASQTLNESPAIERLGIPAYNWWNEALHGVARAGIATVFPQAIGMAATFDPNQLKRVGDIIGTEGRAKHHESQRRGFAGYYEGLTFWSPNINIYRDPRWGRGHETYGECPWLTGELGVAFVQGVQGNHAQYLKAAACAKHFAVHSGPEAGRHGFDAEVGDQDLYETYLPAFRRVVQGSRVEAVMGAYNCVNGEPACAHTLLMELLRDRWGFDGHFVSDCGGIADFHQNHRVTATGPESAALAIRMGCDLNCGCTYLQLLDAVGQGLVTEAEIDRCVRRLMRTRMRLGMFDPPEKVPYASTPYEKNDCPEHAAVALEVTRASMVLLQNDGLLPLRPQSIGKLAVIGPHAVSGQELLANYAGSPSRSINILEGIREAFEAAGTTVRYSPGCTFTGPEAERFVVNMFAAETLALAEWSDVVVMPLGLHAGLEGEEGDAHNADASGDRHSLALPEIQLRLLRRVLDSGTPVVVVLIHGGPVTLGGLEDRCAAILDAFYPGPHAGRVVAETLTGTNVPAGRLPMTYPRRVEDLPPFEDYAMRGRTYRFAQDAPAPLFPFGYGLSYTRFEYRAADIVRSDESILVSATVENVGEHVADEVTQVYVQLPHLEEADGPNPGPQLRACRRFTLQPGEVRTLELEIPAEQLQRHTPSGSRLLPGVYTFYIGGSQPDDRSAELLQSRPQTCTLKI